MARRDLGGSPPKKPSVPKVPPIRPGGRGDQETALDKLYQNNRHDLVLTEGARRIASMIPTVADYGKVLPPEYAAGYLPAGAGNRSPGTIYYRPGYQVHTMGDTFAHELLHGFDAMNSGKPSQNLRLTDQQKKALYDKYWGKQAFGSTVLRDLLSGNDAQRAHAMSFFLGLPKGEAYAATGQVGPGMMTDETKKYFADFYK